jgi:uncharacterized protein DUF5658
MAILWIFFALQGCDMATTLLFLRHGVSEGNPLVALVLGISNHPALGLAIVKLAACGIGVLAWRRNRRRLLVRVNLLFAGCVVWNLAAIAVR